jgi:hypothetical protein
MNRTKDELLLECIKQFEHIEDVLGFNRLSTTKSLIKEIEQALRIHDIVGRSEQFYCTCSRAKGLDHDEEGTPYCIECQKPVQ